MSYEVLESKVTHKGMLVTVTIDNIAMPDGSAAYRESVIRGKNAAAVLAVDQDETLIFVRQYRHAFGEMMLEIPAGVLEDGENPAEGIARELEEETGRKAGKLEFICELYPTVGYCTERIQLFIATELKEGVQHLDPDEFIEIERYTLAEAMEMIAKGEIKDGKTIAAIYAWALRKKEA